MSSVTPIFYYGIVISVTKCNFLQSFKNICFGLKNFLKQTVASYHTYYNLIKKWRSTNSIYKPLKLKLSVFLTGYTVAMVTYYAIKIATIGSPMAGHLCDTNVVASHDKH